MLIPSCVFLWHGLAVVLEPFAAREWKAAATLAAEHGIDVTLPRAAVKAFPEMENFMAHPFFRPFLDAEKSNELDILKDFSKVIRPCLPRTAEAADSGQSADLFGALEALDSSIPGLLRKTAGKNSVGEKLLSAIDQSRIPWHDLATAARRPSSQLPPVGSTAPEDDYTAPENTLKTPHGIVEFLLIANLRTLAAIEAGKQETARESLLIQMRVADSFLTTPYLLHAALGNAFQGLILTQVRTGMALRFWQPANLDWIAGWLSRSDRNAGLKAAFESEMLFELSSISFTERNPGAADRQYAAMAEILGAENTGNILAPFRQEWLCFLRGRTEPLYQLAPPAVFQWWCAYSVRTACKKQLRPLKENGLLGVAFPNEPEESVPDFFSQEKLALSFLENEARIRLFLTARVLHEWHAIHQNFPETLASLPSFRIDAVQTDPFSAKPLIYHRLSSTAYRLYSVGGDLQDDGGSLIQEDGGGDICWHLQGTAGGEK